MNSRRAQKEISANRVTVTPWPSRKAAARVANKIQAARTRRAKVSRMAVSSPLSGRRFNSFTVPQAAPKSTSTAPINPKVLRS